MKLRDDLIEAAILDLDLALEFDRGNAGALALRGLARSEANRPQQALADCRRALKLDQENGRANRCLGLAQHRLDDSTAALITLNAEIVRHPTSAAGYFWRAMVKSESGDSAGALADFDSALANSTRFGEAILEGRIAELAAAQ